MQKHQRIWFKHKGRGDGEERRSLWSRLLKHIRLVKVVILGLVLLGSGLGIRAIGAFAQAPCHSGDRVYSVVSGDTLGGIATRYHTTWQRLASYNHLTNPNLIYVHQIVCIPGKPPVRSGP